MDKIAVKYDDCYMAAKKLRIISNDINDEIMYINEIISELSGLTSEYQVANIEIDELYTLKQKLKEECESTSILSGEITKYVEKVKDLDAKIESKIDRDFDNYITSKLEFKDDIEDRYRVIGGTYIYPDREPSFGFGDLENLDLTDDSSSLFYLDFIKRRIAYEKNKNRLEALKLSKNKYKIDYKDMQEADNIFKKGLYFLKYSFDRTFGLYGEMQSDFLKIQGMNPELADLAGDFSSGIMLEPFIVLGANAIIFRGISKGESVVAGSGLGPLEGKIKGVKGAEGPTEADFYVGPKGKTLSSKYKDWIGTNRGKELLNSADNSKLQNAVKQLYRGESIVGDGGTADVIRFERETGMNLGKNGNTHMQKGGDMQRYLQKIIDTENLSPTDSKLANELLNDLKNALGGN